MTNMVTRKSAAAVATVASRGHFRSRSSERARRRTAAADPAVPAPALSVVDVDAPVRVVRPRRGPWLSFAKSAFDRTVAGGALLVLAVPMAGIAAVVAVTLGHPVLFRQRRVGLDGEVFEVLKFRTMRPDRRARALDVIHDRRLTHKTPSDPRHTRVGRFLRRYSLDELPQLINVVRGEMSIVGPRPELESVVATYPPGLEQRHQLKPGLTGLWQVSARGDGPMHENGEWDLDYVERASFRTDVAILVRTPKALLGTGS